MWRWGELAGQGPVITSKEGVRENDCNICSLCVCSSTSEKEEGEVGEAGEGDR